MRKRNDRLRWFWRRLFRAISFYVCFVNSFLHWFAWYLCALAFTFAIAFVVFTFWVTASERASKQKKKKNKIPENVKWMAHQCKCKEPEKLTIAASFFYIFHCSAKNSLLKLQSTLWYAFFDSKEERKTQQKENIIATTKCAPAATTLYFIHTAHVYYIQPQMNQSANAFRMNRKKYALPAKTTTTATIMQNTHTHTQRSEKRRIKMK